MSTVERGDVRSRVDFEGAGDVATGFARIEATLGQVARTGRQTSSALERIGQAFTPLRRNLEIVNQIRGVFNMATQAVRTFGRVAEDIANRVPETRAALDRLEGSADRLADSFAQGVNTGGRYATLLDEIAQSFDRLSPAAAGAGNAISWLLDNTIGNQILAWANALEQLQIPLEQLRDEFAAAAPPTLPGTSAAPGYGVGVGVGVGATSQGVGTGEVGGGVGTRPRRRGGGGGRGQAREPDMVFGTWEEEGRAAQVALEAEQEAVTAALDDLRSYEEAAEGELNEAARARSRWWAEDWRARMDLREQEHQAHLDQIEEAARAEEAASLAQLERDEERRQRITDTFQGLSGVAQGLGDILETVAAAEEERGKNADKWRRAVGVAKGTLYAIEAVAAAATMGMAIAEQNYLGAVAAGEAMVNYGIASGYMFSKLAGTGGGGVSVPSSAGTFTPTQPSRVKGSTAGPGNDRPIVVLGLGNTDAGVAAAVWRANEQLVRSGRAPIRGSAGVGYQG